MPALTTRPAAIEREADDRLTLGSARPRAFGITLERREVAQHGALIVAGIGSRRRREVGRGRSMGKALQRRCLSRMRRSPPGPRRASLRASSPLLVSSPRPLPSYFLRFGFLARAPLRLLLPRDARRQRRNALRAAAARPARVRSVAQLRSAPAAATERERSVAAVRVRQVRPAPQAAVWSAALSGGVGGGSFSAVASVEIGGFDRYRLSLRRWRSRHGRRFGTACLDDDLDRDLLGAAVDHMCTVRAEAARKWQCHAPEPKRSSRRAPMCLRVWPQQKPYAEQFRALRPARPFKAPPQWCVCLLTGPILSSRRAGWRAGRPQTATPVVDRVSKFRVAASSLIGTREFQIVTDLQLNPGHPPFVASIRRCRRRWVSLRFSLITHAADRPERPRLGVPMSARFQRGCRMFEHLVRQPEVERTEVATRLEWAGTRPDEALAPQPLHLLVHVRKCAGSTVQQFVLRHFPGRVLAPQRRRAPARYWSRSQYSLADSEDLDRVAFIIGHFFGVSITRHFPNRTIRPSILLRDPLVRTLSLYNYNMQRYVESGGQSVPFGLWYASRPRNAISDFILHNFLELPWWQLRLLSRRNRMEILEEALGSFWFTGSHTECGKLISSIAQAYGCRPDFIVENVTRFRLVSENDLPASLRARILHENELDTELFARFGAHVSIATHATDDRLKTLLKDLETAVRGDGIPHRTVVRTRTVANRVGPTEGCFAQTAARKRREGGARPISWDWLHCRCRCGQPRLHALSVESHPRLDSLFRLLGRTGGDFDLLRALVLPGSRNLIR